MDNASDLKLELEKTHGSDEFLYFYLFHLKIHSLPGKLLFPPVDI